MKIAFEVQPLIQPDKTGVPWNAQMMINTIMNQYPNNNYSLLYFKFRNHGIIPDNVRTLALNIPNCIIKKNRYLPYGIYRRIWNLINLDYSRFFNEKAEIYHFFNFICPPKVSGKVVLTVYDMVHKVMPETMEKSNLKRLEKDLLRSCNQADAIVTISQNSKTEIAKYLDVPLDKIYVVECGVDLERFNPYYNKTEIEQTKKKYSISNEYFLYLGTLEPRKNISRIIDAYYQLINKNNNLLIPKLVIAGKKGWLYDNLFLKVDKYGLKDKVLFPGYIDDEDVPILMKGELAFLFPSLYEGFGMPPLEAMACGTPVITSNTSSLPEVVGDAGILVNPYNVDEISHWMLELLKNEQLRNRLIDKSLKRAKMFTWENSAKKMMNIYEDLLES